MKKLKNIVSLVLAIVMLQTMCVIPTTAYQTDTQQTQVAIRLSDCSIQLDPPGFTYDGKEKYPSVVVTYNGRRLNQYYDYNVFYEDNVNASTSAKVIIKGMDNSSGTYQYNGQEVTKKFTIYQKSINNATLTLSKTRYTYDGNAKKPSVVKVICDGEQLKSSDYTVSYSNNVNVTNSAEVTVTGKGNYKGTVTGTFSIMANNPIEQATQETTQEPYNPIEQTTPETTQEPNNPIENTTPETTQEPTPIEQTTPETTQEPNPIEQTTQGTTEMPYVPYPDLDDDNDFGSGGSSSSVLIIDNFRILNPPQKRYKYTGKPIEPKITVRYIDGDIAEPMVRGKDYQVYYTNNINPGKATININGMGKYKEKNVSLDFYIVSEFTFGKDNWQFTNDDSGFPSSTYREQLVRYNDGEYLNKLKLTLKDNILYNYVFEGNWYLPACLDMPWEGSCYGMSALALLSKEGLFPYSEYTAEAKCLYGVESPIENPKVDSLIIYYHMLQCTDTMYLRRIDNLEYSYSPKDIIQLLNKNSTVLFSIAGYYSFEEKDYFYRHTMLAYDYKFENYTIKGKTYDVRIYVYDPNYNRNSLYSDILFDSKTGEWTILHYPDVFIYECQADVNLINAGGLFSGKSGGTASSGSTTSDGTILNSVDKMRVDTLAISENYSIKKLQDDKKSYKTLDNYTVQGDAIERYQERSGLPDAVITPVKPKPIFETSSVSDKVYSDSVEESIVSPNMYLPVKNKKVVLLSDITKSYSYRFNESTPGYDLPDANMAYEFSQNSDEPLHLRMSSNNCLFYAGSEKGKSVLFDKKGFVKVSGKSSDFYFQMTYNDNYPTDWFTIEAIGQNANNSSLRMVDNGYVLSSDNLKDVTVKMNNKSTCVASKFSTEYDSVFIYELNQNTLSIKVDTDKNGTYETELMNAAKWFTNTDGKTSTLSLDVGSDYKLTLPYNSNISETSVWWIPFDNSIASVDENGNVKGVSVGNTTILCNLGDGGFREYRIAVNCEYMTGDLNGDGVISIKDTVIMQRYLLNEERFSKQKKLSADVDGNDCVNLTDVVMITRYLLGYKNIPNVGEIKRTDFKVY